MEKKIVTRSPEGVPPTQVASHFDTDLTYSSLNSVGKTTATTEKKKGGRKVPTCSSCCTAS